MVTARTEEVTCQAQEQEDMRMHQYNGKQSTAQHLSDLTEIVKEQDSGVHFKEQRATEYARQLFYAKSIE